jgi:DNA-binding SARP family transcriptional activator
MICFSGFFQFLLHWNQNSFWFRKALQGSIMLMIIHKRLPNVTKFIKMSSFGCLPDNKVVLSELLPGATFGFSMSKLELFFLGSPRIEREGIQLTTDTRKATALLARLALSGERLSRDLLAAFLWPESDERRAKAALRRTLSDLKATVGGEALLISRGDLGVNPNNTWCDVLVFEEAVAVVKAHEHTHGLCEGCLDQAEEAVALYRDDFMDGFSLRDSRPFDDWQLQEAEYLRREFGILLERLIEEKELTGPFMEAIPLAQKWLKLDPLREEAHRRLIRLYAWTGQRTAALKQYRECVRILQEELGVTPLEETITLYELVLQENLPPPLIKAPPPPEERETPGGNVRSPGSLPFVGREAELAAMRKFFEEAGQDGRLLVLSGEAGIGKTFLAEKFLAGESDAAQLQARSYPGETQLTFAPFVQALRDGLRGPNARQNLRSLPPQVLAEGARLLPELTADFLDIPAPPPLDWPGAQGRFYEGIGHVLGALLAGDRPGFLWLDDLQWADSASLDLLAYLIHRWQKRPYHLLVCWRSGDLAGGSALPQILAGARRSGSGTMISMERLDSGMVDELVSSYMIDREIPANGAEDRMDFSARLFAETEGLPFLVTAYLQTSPLETADADALWAMPPTVRDLFESRLAMVQETEKQILQTAAVIGRPCGFPLLQAASGRSDEETIDALETALAHHLLVEQDPELGYDFSHHKLRDLVIDDMSLARKRLLHRRVAKILAIELGVSEKSPSEFAARIARHYQQAGLDQKAAAYFFQAAEYARGLFANREALEHYLTALALGYPEKCLLHEISGDLHVRLGQYTAALNHFERAAITCPPQHLSALEHKIAQVYYRRGDWSAAEIHFQQAESAAASHALADELARIYIDWGSAAYRAGDSRKAQDLLEKARPLAHSPVSQAQINNTQGILERHEGNLKPALAHLSQSLQIAQQEGLMSMEITAANNLALARVDNSEYEAAFTLFEEALALCRRYGERHWEAALQNNLADLHHKCGNEEAAMEHLKAGITIMAEIGREAGDWQPEIWQLSEW